MSVLLRLSRYTVYTIDQTFHGRSPWMPNNGTLTTYSAQIIQQRFTAPQDFNLWPQAHLHTQWPGSGLMGDPVFDAYYVSNVQFISSATYQQSAVQAGGAALLDPISCPVHPPQPFSRWADAVAHRRRSPSPHKTDRLP